MNIEMSPKEYERQLNWYDANIYCQLLVIDNKDDWRLPTKEELNDIYNSENDLTLNDVKLAYFWSSTEDSTNDNAVYVVNFTIRGGYGQCLKNGNNYVRPVRDLK